MTPFLLTKAFHHFELEVRIKEDNSPELLGLFYKAGTKYNYTIAFTQIQRSN
jgi:hypothetical protein